VSTQETLGTLLEDAKYWETILGYVANMAHFQSREFCLPTLVHIYSRLEMLYSQIVRRYLDTRLENSSKLQTYIYNWGYYTKLLADHRKRLDQLQQSQTLY